MAKKATKKSTKKKAAAKTASPAQTSSNEHTVTVILSYLGILVLIPYLVYKKKDEFMKFHIQQGFAFFVVEIILWAGERLLWFIGGIFSLADFIVFVVAIVAMIRGLKGEKWLVPYLEGLTKKMPQ